MRAMLATVAAGAFVTLGAVTSAATAADDPCPGKATASIVLADGSTKLVCIELHVEGETESLSTDTGMQNELLAKLVTALDERSVQERFDPTDVESIQETAKELGIDLDFATASELSAILASAVLGGHKSVLDVLKDGLDGMPGVGDLASATTDGLLKDTVVHAGAGGTDTGPTGSFMPDWSLYADGDDGTDDQPDGPPSDPDEWEPYPGDSSGSESDTPLADPSPPPLVPADDPPLTPDTPGPSSGGPTDTDGAAPPPPPSDPSDNPGNDWINRKIDENPKTAAVIGLIIQAIRLSTGGTPKMTDPDSASGEAGGPLTPDQLEQLETKLNQWRDPVNPDDAEHDPIDPSTAPVGGGDPTVERFDGETITATSIQGSPEANLKLSTAPIDPHPDLDGTLRQPPPEGPDSGTTHVAP
jgi:hypothetical protein